MFASRATIALLWLCLTLVPSLVRAEGLPQPIEPDPVVTPPVGCEDACLWDVHSQDALEVFAAFPTAADVAALAPSLTVVSLQVPTPPGQFLSVYGYLELCATSTITGAPTVCGATGGIQSAQTWCQNIETAWVGGAGIQSCGPRAATFTTTALGRARVECSAIRAADCTGTACVNAQGGASLILHEAAGAIGAFVIGHTDATVTGQATDDSSQELSRRWRYQSSDDNPPPPFWHTDSTTSRGSRSAWFSVTIVQLVCTYVPPVFAVEGTVQSSSTIQAGSRGWIVAQAELTEVYTSASCECAGPPFSFEPGVIYP